MKRQLFFILFIFDVQKLMKKKDFQKMGEMIFQENIHPCIVNNKTLFLDYSNLG